MPGARKSRTITPFRQNRNNLHVIAVCRFVSGEGSRQALSSPLLRSVTLDRTYRLQSPVHEDGYGAVAARDQTPPLLRCTLFIQFCDYIK